MYQTISLAYRCMITYCSRDKLRTGPLLQSRTVLKATYNIVRNTSFPSHYMCVI